MACAGRNLLFQFQFGAIDETLTGFFAPVARILGYGDETRNRVFILWRGS
jgi:hypothetical protein